MRRSEKVCAVDDCEKPTHARGYCLTHYWRFNRHGDPLVGGRSKTTCSVEDCEKPTAARGWCSAHYERFRRHGDPLAGGASPGEPRRWLENHKDHQGDECVVWPFATLPTGYGHTQMNGIGMNASRAMCILAHGEPPEPGLHAAHSCGRGHLGCVNPRHLRWATPAENNADKLDHGTAPRGSRNVGAKLTESEVIEIREVYATGEFLQREIADEVGVNASVISNIVTRTTWKHI